jgi:hypothetical protein
MSDTETVDSPEMSVAPEIMAALTQLRQRSDLLISELGRMEVRKVAIVNEINLLNSKATALLKQESSRLGIPDGVEWRLTPEGKVIYEGANEPS